MVVIDVVALGNARLLAADLTALGMENVGVSGQTVSGHLPIEAIPDMAALPGLKSARPSFAMTNVGSVQSQGDASMRSDTLRALGFDGTGITIGVLSDSFDRTNDGGGLAGGVATGDLPAGIDIRKDGSGSPFSLSDEGRAMTELMADVAPGANFAFYTSWVSEIDFAAGIADLVAIGADIIVDDTLYYAEPMFQDGIIAQAVEAAVQAGVSYFSAAGDRAGQGYIDTFRFSSTGGPSSTIPTCPPLSGMDFDPGNYAGFHDFDPAPSPAIDTLQRFSIPTGEGIALVFQWANPWGLAATDLDLYLIDAIANCVVAVAIDYNVGSFPLEILTFYNNLTPAVTSFDLLIGHYQGPADPIVLAYAIFDSISAGPIEFGSGPGTIYGHPNAAGAMAVGAADYLDTPVFGTTPPVLEPYSAHGPSTPILFDPVGNLLAQAEIRDKPNIVAPDGTNNTFFGFDTDADSWPNYFGTSAAAPHAAALAALIMECTDPIAPIDLYAALQAGTIDIPPSGFDFDSGAGLVQADLALAQLPADYSELPAYAPASHVAEFTTFLGITVTTEVTVSGEINNGVIRTGPWVGGGTADIEVAVGGTGGTLLGWVDWNDDGIYDEPGERVIQDVVPPGQTPLNFSIPVTYTTGTAVNSRFRIFPAGRAVISPQGPACGGEVEDYSWAFGPTAINLRVVKVSSDRMPYATVALISTLLVGVTWTSLLRSRRRR